MGGLQEDLKPENISAALHPDNLAKMVQTSQPKCSRYGSTEEVSKLAVLMATGHNSFK